MGTIVTFYSYKGGTGRSMALANVAWVLAASGARVLVVDWDLEAPGLHRYFRPFLADKELVRVESRGVIDFMIDFDERIADPAALEQRSAKDWYRRYADIAKWSNRLLWPSGQDAVTNLGGTIDFVPAGQQGPHYAKRVNSFDWAGFYQDRNGGTFMEAVRAKMKDYEWVLIDSRTGVADTAGICTIQLPDILVVCFTLNYQSIDGSAAVAASARDDRKGREDRPLRILPLPTRLDRGEEKLLASMAAYAQRAFNPLMDPKLDLARYWPEMGVPYVPRYNYSEKLAAFEVLVNVETSTLPSMERLTGYITDGNVTSLQALPEEGRATALAEFEQEPDSADMPVPDLPTRPGGLRRFVSAVLKEGAKTMKKVKPKMLVVTGIVGFGIAVGVGFRGFDAAIDLIKNPFHQPPVANLVANLTTDASKALQAGRREHAALLIAEAASRLDPATVIDQYRQYSEIFDSLMALLPLKIGDARLAGAAQVVRFSPDGTWLAAASSGGTSQEFQVGPAMKVTVATPNSGWAIAYSPDSRYLASGDRNGGLLVDEAGSSRIVWSRSGDKQGPVNTVAFSPDGHWLAAGMENGPILLAAVPVKVFSALEYPWTEVKQLALPGRVLTLAFSPDSAYLAAGGASSDVLWWSTISKAIGERMGPHKGIVRALAFSPRAKPRTLATASTDGVVHVWTQTSGNPEVIQITTGADVYALAFSPDGSTLATGGLDNQARLWKIDAGKATLTAAFRHGADVRSILFDSSGKSLVTGSGDGTARIWDIAAGSELYRFSMAREVNSVALTKDRRYLAAASADGTVALYLLAAGTNITFSAAQAQRSACTQVTEDRLPAAEWKQYFGSQPQRPTCGQPK